MGRNRKTSLPFGPGNVAGGPAIAVHAEAMVRDNDAALLALENQFNALVAELAAVQLATSDIAGSSEPRIYSADANSFREKIDGEAFTRRADAILADLYPIERAIMQSPAYTIGGLGVKARHAAYVVSQYWEAPVDQVDWDARVIRLLIEAICKL